MEQLDLHMKTKRGIVTKRRIKENLEMMTKIMKSLKNEEVVKVQKKKRKQGTVRD